MQLRGLLLGENEPVEVVVEAPVGVDPRLDAQLGRAELDGRRDPLGELLLGVLVGVRRAASLAEPAERAADDADVRDVDVAVDDERDRVARDLRAQRLAGGALADRAAGEFRRDADPTAATRAPARDERPVVALDHVEDAL